MSALTLDPIVARAYRNARRDNVPARYALAMARASKKGRDLSADAEDSNDGGRSWRVDIAPGWRVDVEQVPDQEACDCWSWARENLRDDGQEDVIPEHGHFGIEARTMFGGREVAYDACWGFVCDWPGEDDDAELARSWDDIAEGAIDHARSMVAAMPAWVNEQVRAWDEDAEEVDA